MPSSDFRVSNRMLVDLSLGNLADNVKKLTDLQDQASSLKRLRKPSDAPADVVSAMGLRSDLNRNDQISRNIGDANAWLGTADNALQGTVSQLQHVHDLMVQAASTSLDPTSRASIANQIDAIRASIIGLANTQYAGRAIFAGTASGAVAYSQNGSYVGVSSPIERTVAPGQRVQVNVNGDEVFGTPGNDLFSLLGQISNAVRNDPAQLNTLSTNFDTATNTVQTALAEVGARFQRVSALQSQNSSDAVTMKKNLSDIEDADIAQVMMNLQTQQVAYQAALQATARAIQPSLADFLR